MAHSPNTKERTSQTPAVRTVFMGTPELSAEFLTALVQAGYPLVGVVTKPDKPIGRKQELRPCPVKERAIASGIPVLTPEKLDDDFLEAFRTWKPELVIVIAYGKILPREVLRLPKHGALNIHASLLPRWRGASPIQNALLAGDAETGVTLMLMDEGVDTGDIIAQAKIAIDPLDTAPVIREKVLEVGRTLLLETLPLWIEKQINPIPQNEEATTLCQLIERKDGQIVWSESAENIFNRYRALFPWPGVYTFWKKGETLLRVKLIKISRQKAQPQMKYSYGEVFEVGENIGVQTGSGVIFLETLQLEGKTPLPIKEFLSGYPDFVGSKLQ